MSKRVSDYIIDPNACMAGKDLHLIQINPRIALNVGKSSDAGYIFEQEAAGGAWKKLRKLGPTELEAAQDQMADMAVLDAAKLDLRAAKEEPRSEMPGFFAKLFKWRAAEKSSSSEPEIKSHKR
jgi:hypothetical protein